MLFFLLQDQCPETAKSRGMWRKQRLAEYQCFVNAIGIFTEEGFPVTEIF